MVRCCFTPAHDFENATAADGGSRLAIVFNGSPLVTVMRGVVKVISGSGSSKTIG